MATHIVAGYSDRRSDDEEAGDDVMMGAGSVAVQSHEDILRVGGALDPAGDSPRGQALDDRFERHAVVGGRECRIGLDALGPARPGLNAA